MKRTWDIEELIEHFTLVPSELELLGNKSGATRLGFALLLKCFQLEGRFPTAKYEIPRSVVDYVAHQLKVDAADAEQYPKLRLILSRAINWDLIRQQYDQMVKYATALRLGTAETEAILRRFTRTGLAHPTYRAFLEL